MTECQHTACSDEPDRTIEVEGGDTFELCEDHTHMNPDGSPVDGYEPNDPEKFSP